MTAPEYLIRKYGGYYRPNCRGYTDDFLAAGRYTLAEAERETHLNGPDGPRDGMTYIHQNDVKRDQYDPKTLASLPEVQALVMAERERCAALVESTAYTSSGDGRRLEPVSAGLVGMDMHHATIAAAIRAGTEGGE